MTVAMELRPVLAWAILPNLKSRAPSYLSPRKHGAPYCQLPVDVDHDRAQRRSRSAQVAAPRRRRRALHSRATPPPATLRPCRATCARRRSTRMKPGSMQRRTCCVQQRVREPERAAVEWRLRVAVAARMAARSQRRLMHFCCPFSCPHSGPVHCKRL